MPLHKTIAVTLRNYDWGEADRLVLLYSRRLGKIRAVARGARRIKSRFGCAFEPFVDVDLDLFERRDDSVYRITQADIRESFQGLREDLDRMYAAARLTNLVTHITAEADPNPILYDCLVQGLRSITHDGHPSLSVLVFQIRTLGCTGFRPQTHQCTSCSTGFRQAVARRPGGFSPALGGLLCDQCAHQGTDRFLPLSPGSLTFIQQALRLPSSVVGRLRARGQVQEEVMTVIDAYVTEVVGKRLSPVLSPPVEIIRSSDTLAGQAHVTPDQLLKNS